ncbi:hypothetical protein [Agrococcus sp. ARC_14]|uniref:hypothetical protein n=1 Tax=Agrococcus sp. ARC_14 TaxID=2919927 RepID=UPI001F06BE9A|nr:hypothetical protein [Agrococcus sp. ARC_14]MCH1883887.1 hypothetical protein [Agrococcus sp. ARC_14]
METAEDGAQVLRAKVIAGSAPGLRPERDARLTRVRHGIYVATTDLAADDRDAAYLLRIQAVHATRPRAVFARESALALHGVPYGLEPAAVYTTGDRRTAGTKAGVVHAQVLLDPRDRDAVGNKAVCTLAYALADVARRCSVLDAVSAIDDALHAGRVTKQQILDALGRQSRRNRSRAEWAITFADGAAESVGESWSRVRAFQLGFAAPELQVWVTGRSGERHRVDMRWVIAGGRPVYGEFDGLMKYGELANRAGKSGVQALAIEKARDDDLLSSGDPAHWVWADVLEPARLERILLHHRVPRVRPRVLDLSRAA